jgi:carbon monoxide dehydrogenase subunit G
VIEASSDVTVPVRPPEAYATLSDLEHAGWLPGVTRLQHIGGPARGVGARYQVEAALAGRSFSGVLACTEDLAPERTVMTIEDGLDLTITATARPAGRGTSVTLAVRYSVGGGLAGRALERASAGTARREVARAMERFAATFAVPTPSRARAGR